MREEQVPVVGREGRINTGEDGQEVCFKCSDGPFCGIAAVHVGWHQLVFAFPGGGDGVLVGVAGFVVEDVCGDSQPPGLQAPH